MTKINKILKILSFVILFIFFLSNQQINIYAVEVDVNIVGLDPGSSVSLQILFLTVLIALLPSILVVMTTFTRIIIVFSFLRSALGTQQMPPNQVLIGLALMLTIFIMNPFIQEINQNSFQPFSEGAITQEEAIDYAMAPLRQFMMNQLLNNLQHIEFFWELAGSPDIETWEDIPNYILIPAFILNELTIGFIIGVIFYVPFIVIDMVVASVLMAMGMMMLPPAMISLPFKILLFVMVDGWRLVIENLISTFVR